MLDALAVAEQHQGCALLAPAGRAGDLDGAGLAGDLEAFVERVIVARHLEFRRIDDVPDAVDVALAVAPHHRGRGIERAGDAVGRIDHGEDVLDRAEQPEGDRHLVMAVVEGQPADALVALQLRPPGPRRRIDRPAAARIAGQRAHAEMQRPADRAILQQLAGPLQRRIEDVVLEHAEHPVVACGRFRHPVGFFERQRHRLLHADMGAALQCRQRDGAMRGVRRQDLDQVEPAVKQLLERAAQPRLRHQAGELLAPGRRSVAERHDLCLGIALVAPQVQRGDAAEADEADAQRAAHAGRRRSFFATQASVSSNARPSRASSSSISASSMISGGVQAMVSASARTTSPCSSARRSR